MKLCVCIIHNRDRTAVTDELVRAGYQFTVIGSTGGFLREGNSTMMVGCDDAEVEALGALLKANCQTRKQVVNVPAIDSGPQGGFLPGPVEVQVGGAVMFVLNVEQFDRC